MLVRWQGKSDFESRRNSLRTRHGDEQRMKVGAVAFFGVASVEHITASPTGASLVITHSRENVIVDSTRLVERRGLAFASFHRQVCGQTRRRHKRIRS